MHHLYSDSTEQAAFAALKSRPFLGAGGNPSITNLNEERLLAYRVSREIARAIADGIVNFRLLRRPPAQTRQMPRAANKSILSALFTRRYKDPRMSLP